MYCCNILSGIGSVQGSLVCSGRIIRRRLLSIKNRFKSRHVRFTSRIVATAIKSLSRYCSSSYFRWSRTDPCYTKRVLSVCGRVESMAVTNNNFITSHCTRQRTRCSPCGIAVTQLHHKANSAYTAGEWGVRAEYGD